MAENLGVSDQTPTVSKLITRNPVVSVTDATVNVPVPLSILKTVQVYMPPGLNWRIGVGIGFNGKKLIPTQDPDDFIFGPGVLHTYEAGWQVQSGIDVFFRQNNRIVHQIYVTFHLDRRPTQRTAVSNLIMPS